MENRGHYTTEQNLTVRQRRLIEALLASPSLTEACRVAKVSRVTAYTWLRQPAFSQALSRAQADLLAHGTRRLLNLQAKALEALERLLDDADAPPAVRLSTAKAVLEMALRYHDIVALEQRIRTLEQEVSELTGRLTFGGGA